MSIQGLWIVLILLEFLVLCDSFRMAPLRTSTPRPTRLAAGKVGTNLHKAGSLVEDMQAIRNQVHLSVPLSDDPLLPMVLQIAKSADLRKAASVNAMRVSHLTEVTQFVVLIEGSNNRQISALADIVEVHSRRTVTTHRTGFRFVLRNPPDTSISFVVQDDLSDHFHTKAYVKDGTALSGWSVLDYGKRRGSSARLEHKAPPYVP
jgi:hypothetical protein